MGRFLLILSICFYLNEGRADDRFYVTAKINGKPAVFVFDTGSDRSLLWSNSAVRLGLTNFLGGPDYRTTELSRVSIGTTNCSMWFTIISLPQWVDDSVADGILGWPALKENILRLDAETGTIDCLPFLPHDIYKWDKVSIDPADNTLSFKFKNQKRKNTFLAIDTGDGRGIALPQYLWQKWRLANLNQPVTLNAAFNPFAGITISQESWANKIDLGKLSFADVPILEEKNGLTEGTSHFGGVIGMAALKRKEVILDGPKKTAYLRSKLTPPVYYGHNCIAAHFIPADLKDQELRGHVLTDGPAFEAGFRDGDILLKVNGKDVAGWRNHPNTFESFNSPETNIILTIRRGSNEITATIKSRQILYPCASAKEIIKTATGGEITNNFSSRNIHFMGNTSIEYMSRGSAESDNDLPLAIADYTEAIKLNPKMSDAYESRGEAYCNIGEPKKTVKDLSKAIELGDNTIQALWYRAKAYGMETNVRKSIRDLKSAIILDPSNSFLFVGLGQCYSGLRQYQQATDCFTKAISLNPTNTLAWVECGRAYAGRSNINQAVLNVSNAIQLGDEKAVGLRAEYYFDEGNYKSAMQDYTAAIARDPSNAPYRYFRGYCYWKLNRDDLAILDFTECLDIDPKYAAAYETRGYIYMEQSNIDKGVIDFNKAILLEPANAVCYEYRGFLFQLKGLFAKAVQDYRKSLSLDSTNVDTLGYLAWLEATCPNPYVRNGKEALAMAKTSCRLTRWNNSKFIEIFSAALAENGQFKQAIKFQLLAINFCRSADSDQKIKQRRLAMYESSQPWRDGSKVAPSK